MTKYTRLSFTEREEISRQIALGVSIRCIAKTLNRSASTISREINRTVKNKQHYRAISAQNLSNKIRHKPKANRKLDKNVRLRNLVFYYILKKRWTPEQVANRLKMLYPNNMAMRISSETIYSYIYVWPRSTLKKEIVSCLRRRHKNRKSRKPRHKSCPIQDYLSIEERPAEVASRTVPGHWEGDLVMGSMNRSAIGTLVERTSRLTILVKLTAKDAESVRKAFAKEFKYLPKGLKKTLTYDQGQEMAQHKLNCLQKKQI